MRNAKLTFDNFSFNIVILTIVWALMSSLVHIHTKSILLIVPKKLKKINNLGSNLFKRNGEREVTSSILWSAKSFLKKSYFSLFNNFQY